MGVGIVISKWNGKFYPGDAGPPVLDCLSSNDETRQSALYDQISRSRFGVIRLDGYSTRTTPDHTGIPFGLLSFGKDLFLLLVFDHLPKVIT